VRMSNKKYFFQWDAHAFFDQSYLETPEYHVIRVREPVMIDGEEHTTFALCKSVMGSVATPACLNTVTWALMEPLIKMAGLETASMIDNIAIATDSKETFVKAFQLFVKRCDDHGVKLNDREKFPKHPENIARLGLTTAKLTTFLGEEYSNSNGVRNTERNLKKLKEAWERMQSAVSKPEEIGITTRMATSLVSLALWMANTIEIPLCNHFPDAVVL
jgi:hypothetical protein